MSAPLQDQMLQCGHSSSMDCPKSCKDEGKCLCCVCGIQRGPKEGPADIPEKIQLRKRSIKVLQQAVDEINLSADGAVEHSEGIFTELACLMEKRGAYVRKQVRSHQDSEVRRMKELQEVLEQEITELEKLDTTMPPKKPLPEPVLESAEAPHSKICSLRFFEDMTAAASETRDGLQGMVRNIWTAIDQTKTEISSATAEPKTRAEFLQYSCSISLDPHTAHTQLLLSEEDRKVTLMREEQPYPSHGDRFIRWRQALSKESLTGRCYFEVEWRKKRVNVAVSYKNIQREGPINECAFGFCDNSWALECNTNSGCKFVQDGVKTRISGSLSSRVGVYLDHGAGLLSFYSISKTMKLLHKVQTTFTQPLHVGFWLAGYNGASAELCKMT